MAFTTVPVTGSVKYEDGTPCAGTVKFSVDYPIHNGETTQSADVTFTLSSGAVPGGSTVKALNDPGTYPDLNPGYLITVTVGSYVYKLRRYARAGQTLDLGTIVAPTPKQKVDASEVVIKAGALTTTDLPFQGMIGIDTTNHRIYVNETGAAVKYAALT